ncbi:MAG: glycosyltransferase [Paludibacteraceae bacterium]|nr:glycosyltransferase [Paludibacteraceae bacterium]
MKPRLIIVCGILYPHPSPTGLCALRYASLLKEDYEIEFISLSSNGYAEDVDYAGFRVHTLTSRRLSLEHRTKGAVQKVVHGIGSVQLKLFLTGNLRWYRRDVRIKLEQLHSQRPIDVILTVCSPFPAHQAGMDFKQKHKEVRFCAYTVDPFATPNRIVPIGRKYYDLIATERKVCESTDCLFLSEEALSSRQDVYGRVPNVMALPYLLPEAIPGRNDYFNNEAINCVYAGSFYKEIRNPEFMLKVFSALKGQNIVLHLFSSGCDDIVRQYAQNNDGIVTHGYVSQEELRDVYTSCDFLVGVGNATHEFLPSKTYEYLSLRRPIVFFNPKGFHNEVLGKYPCSLQISDDMMIKDAVLQLENFIINNRVSVITNKELQEIYHKNTPPYIKSMLLKGLSNN